ncbi:MAG: hypothetical protein ACTS2F_02240 [Thainema sp.]
MMGKLHPTGSRSVQHKVLNQAMLLGAVLVCVGITTTRPTSGVALEPADDPHLPDSYQIAIAAVATDTSQPHTSQPHTSQADAAHMAQSVREPVGRIDPDQPIRIDIVNGGDLEVLFELTQPGTIRRTLPPNGEISFGSTRTSFLPPPVYLAIDPSLNDVGINLYVVSTANNVVEVVVSEQTSMIPGAITLSIEPNGFVYVY